ncbi:hypothetical protein A8C40_00935 [Ligilactobacillus salivarius]|nr:hypothetical protein A8C40_00935 [Ligilactobacillus salivarius]
MELTVFLQNGATYHFIDVENVSDDVILEFDYYGQTVSKKRHAMFDLEQIAGYAVDNEKVEDNSTDDEKDVKVPLKYREHIDVNQAIDDVLNFDTENGDKETAKIINDRLYTAIIQDYMEKNGSEIDEDKLGDHFMKLMWKKLVKDFNEEEKEKDFDF